MTPAPRAVRWLVLAMVLSPALVVAAPVPRSKDEPVSLGALHALVAKATNESDLPTTERLRVEATVRELLARLTGAIGLPDRAPPVAFDALTDTRFVAKGGPIVQDQKKWVVAHGGRVILARGCVLLLVGDAEVVQAHECVIVVGGDAKVSQCRGCVVIGAKGVTANQCSPPRVPDGPPPPTGVPGATGCVVVAGDRLRLSQCTGTLAHVVRPAAGSDPPIDSHQGTDTLVLNDAKFVKSHQDRNLLAGEPKARPAR